jgi:predicted DNA-binding transcriptional regulator AlpA
VEKTHRTFLPFVERAVNDDIPLFLTVLDLAKLLRIGRWSIFNYIRQGRLPQPQRITSRNIRWHRDDLADVLRFGPMAKGHYHTEPPADLGDAIRQANEDVSVILTQAAEAAEPPPAPKKKHGRPAKKTTPPPSPKAKPKKPPKAKKGQK